ncbi:hypothetical protein LCGC14_2436980, partial [marine sediment metagenome]
MKLSRRLLIRRPPLTSDGAHLIDSQVRPLILHPHLNGVQVVAGSNPATPTNDFHSNR